ncbi:ADP-ribosylglycohydrolase family protein, partial [Streptomyces sp. NPDC054840]
MSRRSVRVPASASRRSRWRGSPCPGAAELLGSGRRISAPDTVPFALWCAAGEPDDVAEALWRTLEGWGDRDTTCAIVGGVVAARAGLSGV